MSSLSRFAVSKVEKKVGKQKPEQTESSHLLFPDENHIDRDENKDAKIVLVSVIFIALLLGVLMVVVLEKIGNPGENDEENVAAIYQ